MRNMRKVILRGDLIAMSFAEDIEEMLLEKLESYSDDMTDEELDDYSAFVKKLRQLNDLKLEALLQHQKELAMLRQEFAKVKIIAKKTAERCRRELAKAKE